MEKTPPLWHRFYWCRCLVVHIRTDSNIHHQTHHCHKQLQQHRLFFVVTTLNDVLQSETKGRNGIWKLSDLGSTGDQWLPPQHSRGSFQPQAQAYLQECAKTLNGCTAHDYAELSIVKVFNKSHMNLFVADAITMIYNYMLRRPHTEYFMSEQKSHRRIH